MGRSSASPPRRLPQSCLACRQIKVKCLGNEDRTGRCDRCVRLDFSCVYEQKRRGRKTNAERAARAATQPRQSEERPSSPQQPPATIGFANTGLSANDQAPMSLLSRPPQLQANIPFYQLDPPQTLVPFASPRTQGMPLSDNNLAPPTMAPFPPAQTLSTGPSPLSTVSSHNHPSAAPRLDVSDYLDPPLPTVNGIGGTTSVGDHNLASDQSHPSPGDNPVTLGFISRVEAENLVQLYHQHLNPILAHLDPELHTFEYLITSLPLLLTSILAAASKFFRSTLHRNLLEYAHVLLNRSLNAGTCNIDIIQALLVLVCFKAPVDRSAWIKIGQAIRLAYQHGWYMRRKRILPTDAYEARRTLDPERTWYCLICFDRKYARSFGLPTMIRANDIEDPEVWAREHLHLAIPTDMHLACSLEVTTVHAQLERVSRADSSNKEFWRVFLDDLYRDHQSKSAKWFGDNGLESHLGPSSKLLLKFTALSSSLAVKQRAIELLTDTDDYITDYLGLVPQVVDQVEAIAKAGLITFLHDITAATLSEITLVMFKLFWQLSINQKSMAIALVKRMHAVCLEASGGNDTVPTAFVARFTQKTLRALRTESRAPSPTGNQPSNTQGDADFVSDLNEFLQSADLVPDATDQDERFWWSVFAPGMGANSTEDSMWS